MKKSLFIVLFFITSLAFAQTYAPYTPKFFSDEPSSDEKELTKNNEILKEFIEKHSLIGKTIKEINDSNIKFPKEFFKFQFRVINENTIVVMDYSYNRLNFYLDKNEKVKSIQIG